jgi:hypothetical protein
MYNNVKVLIKSHKFATLFAAKSRSHIFSAPALSLFNVAIFIIVSPTEGFSRYECNGESPSAEGSCQKIYWQP